MKDRIRTILLFALAAALIVGTGFLQSWNTALIILNMGLISAVMSLGVNMQWGYAGLFNVGILGFVALGGLATVLIAMPPTTAAWSAGGARVIAGLVCGAVVVAAVIAVFRHMKRSKWRALIASVLLVGGFFLYRGIFDPGVEAVEAVNPAISGYLGGFGLPVLLAWPAGGLLAAGAAWIIGKSALGLRSDYLAIATLGIAEIILAIIKNEDWLARGVKNVIGIPRPVPYEIDLQNTPYFAEKAISLGMDPVTTSSLFVKLSYSLLFSIVLVFIVALSQLSLNSPWGRMMRAIRDNETAASAMGKDITARHLQIFILGSAVCGIAGAMMTTLDSQLTPTSYQPLRFTFLIWVMVIVGGSGNNLGAVLGGFLIWFLWVQVEPAGLWLIRIITSPLAEDNALRAHLIENAAHMRLLTMGLILILMLRLSPKGLIPEK